MPHADVIRTDGADQGLHAWATTRSRALRGIDLPVERGEMVADHGRLGLGQVDADEHPRLPRPADRRRLRPGRRARRRPGPRTSSPTCATGRSASSSRASTCWPRTSALENVELPLLYDRARHARRDTRAVAAQALERGRAWPTARPPAERALGRPAAAGGHRPRPGHRAGPPAGRRAHRQPRHPHLASRCWRSSRSSTTQGITILIVTHEHDIARYAKRIVELRDGRVVRDEPVRDRRDAGAGPGRDRARADGGMT